MIFIYLYSYSYIFWVDASSIGTMLTSFKAMAEKCLPALLEESATLQDLSKALFNWVSSQKIPWLVVFDNADYSNALEDIEACLPHCNLGHIIITSRNPFLGRLTSHDSEEIVVMTEKDSISLLLHAANIRKRSNETINSAKALVHMLGFLPLAIDLAGAAIHAGSCSISGYISLFSKSRSNILSQNIIKGASHYEESVYGAFELSFREIQSRADRQDEAAQTALHLLDIFACVHHENISVNIFEYAAQNFADINFKDDIHQQFECVDECLKLSKEYFISAGTGKWDDYRFFIGMQVLSMFSFVKSDSVTISIHPLIHGYLWDRLSLEKQKYCTLISGAILVNCIAFGSGDKSLWRELIPHVVYNMSLFEKITLSQTYFDDLYSKYSSILDWNGEYEKAIRLKIQVLTERRIKLGEDHPDTLSSMASLAATYRNQGRWAEAEALQMQVMTIRKTKLGENHSDTLSSMANLAATYRKQGRWSEAEVLQVQGMTIIKAKLGEDHPDTLSSMANLASTYWNQGRWSEAEALDLQVMTVRKTKFGEDHPDTLSSMANLASTYWNQGRWSEAEALDLQVIAISKTKLGDDHLDTLSSMANLAATHRNQGRWSEAEALQVQVMTIRKAKLGEAHPDTLSSMAKLAVTYRSQGRWCVAEALQLQVITISKTKLGEDHPSTLRRIDNLAATFQNQGKWAEAEVLQVQVMTINKTKLGEDHPDTLSSMDNLAETYRNQGRWSAAEALQMQATAVSKTKLGENHPSTLRRMNNLATTYRH